MQALSAKLSWSHFVQLAYIDDSIKRKFYATMAAQERWSTRTLENRIGSLLFERTAISKKPDETIVAELELLREKGEYNQSMVLKDPYILDFLDLNDCYMEKDLEDAILREIEQFLLELGAGFTFIARQKRSSFLIYRIKIMKKLLLIILSCITFITGCSTQRVTQLGTITHVKFADDGAIAKIDNLTYELRSGHKTMQEFQNFYRDYYPKVARQALSLHILTDNKADFIYSFFIETKLLNQDTRVKLEELYQAKIYQGQYMMVSFSASAEPYYGNGLENIAVDKYKLEEPISILITETTPFFETGGGQVLLLLTSPVWVPFMLLFGLKV